MIFFFFLLADTESSSTVFSLCINWAFAVCILCSLPKTLRNWLIFGTKSNSNTTFWCYYCHWLHWIAFAIWSCSHHSQLLLTRSRSSASHWFCVTFWMVCHHWTNVNCLVTSINFHYSSAPHCLLLKLWALSSHWKAIWRHRNRLDRHLECWMLACCSSLYCTRHLVSWATGSMERHQLIVLHWICPEKICKHCISDLND